MRGLRHMLRWKQYRTTLTRRAGGPAQAAALRYAPRPRVVDPLCAVANALIALVDNSLFGPKIPCSGEKNSLIRKYQGIADNHFERLHDFMPRSAKSAQNTPKINIFLDKIPVLREFAPSDPHLLHARFHRVLHVLDLLDLDVAHLPSHVLDAADVDRLDHVARLRIDRDRAARALPGHALGGGDQALAIALAGGFFQRLVDEVHAVIAAERKQIGGALELGV